MALSQFLIHDIAIYFFKGPLGSSLAYDYYTFNKGASSNVP
jgi:hypothetical protein